MRGFRILALVSTGHTDTGVCAAIASTMSAHRSSPGEIILPRSQRGSASLKFVPPGETLMRIPDSYRKLI